MVNVGEYTIHGSYGIGILKEWSVCHICSFKISTWVGWSLLIVRDLYIRGRHLCGICTHIIHNPSNNRKTTRFLSFTAKLDVQLKQFPWEFLLEHNDNPPEKDPQTVRLSWGLWLHNIDFCPKQWMLPIRNTGPIWVFPKIGEPRNGWFIMETLYWNGWFGGYHYFRKHPFEHVNFCLDRNKKQEHFKSAGQQKKHTQLSLVLISKNIFLVQCSPPSVDERNPAPHEKNNGRFSISTGAGLSSINRICHVKPEDLPGPFSHFHNAGGGNRHVPNPGDGSTTHAIYLWWNPSTVG